jgi:hypothetical protein
LTWFDLHKLGSRVKERLNEKSNPGNAFFMVSEIYAWFDLV